MKISHDLKIDRQNFLDVVEGRKKSEVRINDRDFRVGDFLHLREFNSDSQEYSGKELIVKITHFFSDEIFLQPGYVVLSFIITWVKPF